MVLRISRSSVIPPSDGMGWGWDGDASEAAPLQ